MSRSAKLVEKNIILNAGSEGVCRATRVRAPHALHQRRRVLHRHGVGRQRPSVECSNERRAVILWIFDAVDIGCKITFLTAAELLHVLHQVPYESDFTIFFLSYHFSWVSFLCDSSERNILTAKCNVSQLLLGMNCEFQQCKINSCLATVPPNAYASLANLF